MTKSPRGRPLKYGRPSRVVAVTLPEDTIDHLLRIHSDIGRAIVTLVSDLASKDALPPDRLLTSRKWVTGGR